MDDLFNNIGETLLEQTTNPPAPKSTKRVIQYIDRLKAKIANLESEKFPEPEDPFSYLLRLMNDPSEPISRRCKIAIELAKIMYDKPKRTAKLVGIKEQRDTAATKAATGQFAPASAPKRFVN